MEASTTSLNSELKFKNGTTRNAARISKGKWEEHKELLCSLYQEKTITEILSFMRTEHDFMANACQLGRKLREWAVYKYDSKNRPSILVRSASDDSNVPHSGPGNLFEANLKSSPAGVPPSTDASTIIPPALDNFAPYADSMVSEDNQASASANTGSDIFLPIEDSKTHPFSPAAGSIWSDFIMVLQIYDDALLLVKGVRRREDRTSRIRLHNILSVDLKESIRADALVIKANYERSLVYFTDAYDSQAQRLIEDILVILQVNVDALSSLEGAWTDYASFDYTAFISALEECKVDGLLCLDRWHVSHPLSAIARKAMPREWNKLGVMLSDLALESLGYLGKEFESGPKAPDDFDQFNSAQDSQALHEDTAFTEPIKAIVTEEPKSGALRDIYTDRVSVI